MAVSVGMELHTTASQLLINYIVLSLSPDYPKRNISQNGREVWGSKISCEYTRLYNTVQITFSVLLVTERGHIIKKQVE